MRKRKHRDEKPLAVMARDIDTAGKIAVISPEEEAALNSFRKPIVLLRKKEGCSLDHLSDNNYIGIMLPYTPLHCLLLADGPELLVMTSANLSDLPIIYKNDQALKELHGIADGFLLHDREIVTRCDDSLIRIFRGREYPLRRSRGYVPYPVRIGTEGVRTDAGDSGGILACGAEQKASFALTKGDLVFTSQHIGDLKNIEAFDNYAGQIRHFEKMFDIEVNEIVCDLHPDLMSSDYARARASKDGIKLHMVQHHHAHMASCMADNSLSGKCIGIIWDGTGYGTDGTIWGGEFFTGDYTGFERAGSIRPVKLAGGDLAVREIWRCAAALLEDAGIDSREFFSGRLKGSKQDRLGAVISQLKMNINCPVSGGMGRLFDGVSAMLGLRYNVSYEGQGAVLLEAAAGSSEGSYPYAITEIYGPDGIVKRSEFDSRDMVRAICKDIEKGRDSSLIAADFMNTLVLMAVEMCEKIRKISGLSRVVLSGGTFQNMYLLERIVSGLSDAGFEVFTHRRAAANDEGISLGQAAIIFFSKKQI